MQSHRYDWLIDRWSADPHKWVRPMYRQLHKVLNLVKKKQQLKNNNTKCVLYCIMVVSFFELRKCVLNLYFYFSGVMIGEAPIFFFDFKLFFIKHFNGLIVHNNLSKINLENRVMRTLINGNVQKYTICSMPMKE